jgi:hypothetical protein
MARRTASTDDGVVSRLLVVWTRPRHLSTEEADDWVEPAIARILVLDGLAWAELTVLESAAVRYWREWDWLLELHLAAGVDRQDWLARDAWVDWMADLRLLGMRPQVMVADDRRRTWDAASERGATTTG